MVALGFYTFKAPCVNVASIEVGSIDIDWASVWSGNPKGTVELYISLNINNTNPYGLVYNGTDTQGYIRQGETDVGHFDIPHGVAKAKYQSIETITATLKAGGDGGVPVSDLTKFASGESMTLTFGGAIVAVGWIADAPAEVGFKCNATVSGTTGSEAFVDCYAEYEVTGDLVNQKGSATVSDEDMKKENRDCWL